MSIEVFKIGNEHKDFMEHKEEEWVRYSDYSALTETDEELGAL